METVNCIKYPLFVAMTREPMIMGVSMLGYVLNLMASMLLFVMTKNFILAISFFYLIYLISLMGCKKDERYFDILLGKLSLMTPNYKKWGCNSYDPQ